MIYTFDIPYTDSSRCQVSVCVDVRADSEEQAVERMRRYARLRADMDERHFLGLPTRNDDETAEAWRSMGEEVGTEGILELRFYLDIGHHPEQITAEMIGDIREDE